MCATENREKIWESMQEYREILNPDNNGWKILEIGIDGDPKPSGNYKYFGKGNDWVTSDFLEELNPDVVDDITNSQFLTEQFYLVICSQVLEHIFNFPKAISEIYRILNHGGYAIIDCPFYFPYHGLPNYDDFWRISEVAMRKLLINAGFEIIKCQTLGPLTTALVEKK